MIILKKHLYYIAPLAPFLLILSGLLLDFYYSLEIVVFSLYALAISSTIFFKSLYSTFIYGGISCLSNTLLSFYHLIIGSNIFVFSERLIGSVFLLCLIILVHIAQQRLQKTNISYKADISDSYCPQSIDEPKNNNITSDNTSYEEKIIQNIYNAIPALVWVCDKNKYCYFANKTWLDFTESTLEDIKGLGWSHNIHEEDFESFMKNFTSAFDNEHSFETEIRLYKSDKKYRWMQVKLSPFYNQDQQFDGFIGIALDLTIQKKSLKDKKYAKQEFQTLLDAVPVMIFYKDVDDIILQVNQKVLDNMRLKQNDIIGQSMKNLYPKTAEKNHKSDLEVIYTGQPKFKTIEQIELPHGKIITVLTDRIPYLDQDQNIIGVICMSIDISNTQIMAHTTQKAKNTIS